MLSSVLCGKATSQLLLSMVTPFHNLTFMSSDSGSSRLIGFKNDVSNNRHELDIVHCFPQIMMRKGRKNNGLLNSLGFCCNGLHGDF